MRCSRKEIPQATCRAILQRRRPLNPYAARFYCILQWHDKYKQILIRQYLHLRTLTNKVPEYKRSIAQLQEELVVSNRRVYSTRKRNQMFEGEYQYTHGNCDDGKQSDYSEYVPYEEDTV